MKIRVLGCYGGQLQGFHLTSFLVNDTILLDAGAPTSKLTLEEQHNIRHIFISHTHLDHILDIAFLSDNRSLKRLGGARKNPCINIHSIEPNLETIKAHFLNDKIWPDFTKIPTPTDPILKLCPLYAEKPITVDGVTITPIMVNHPVPCTAFLLEQNNKQFIYGSDSGCTDRLWEVADAQPNLKGIIVDCSFPNAYQYLANISGHLTPHDVASEMRKFKNENQAPVYLYHMKPETLSVMNAEIEALDIPHLRTLTQVDELTF
ncbi:MAG: 3',5'-cyclic-nucleotide phosphodiesterase [Mariprofundaceae bacterium]|nr:3',5'-cyclic-nucleotide phosphodiesterase [Mariprofundaceae bacterium]